MGVGSAQMLDPNGRIDKDHVSRDLGLTEASGSEPPRRARCLADSLAIRAWRASCSSAVCSHVPVSAIARETNSSSSVIVASICRI